MYGLSVVGVTTLNSGSEGPALRTTDVQHLTWCPLCSAMMTGWCAYQEQGHTAGCNYRGAEETDENTGYQIYGDEEGF